MVRELEIIRKYWGREAERNILHVLNTNPYAIDALQSIYQAHGSNWDLYFFSTIETMCPELYNAIPDGIGWHGLDCVASLFELIKQDGIM